jgi:hypothetical protein
MMIKIIGYVGMLLVLYWLPGAACSTLLEWKGVGRAVRWLAPFAITLVAAPLTLVVLSIFRMPLPPWIILAAATLVCFAFGFILRRFGKRPVWEFRTRTQTASPAWDAWAGAIYLLFVAFIAFLPRLDLLLHGSQIISAGISDIYWHLSELTSIARSGMPPQHFLFPDFPLDYYYWSWLLPAAAAGLPWLGESLMRLMNAHVLLNLLVFLFILFAFLRANIGSWKVRWITMFFLTLGGGFDFFTQPNMYSHEWWQTSAPWLVSQTQIPSFLVTYMWVPQHVAGLTAFLLVLFLWRNVRGNLLLRGALASGCAAFMVGTSSFIFLAFCLAGLVWAVFYRRLWMRRRALPGLALAIGLFFLIAGPQILLTVGQESVVQWSGFRLNLFEALGTLSRNFAPFLDQAITGLAFPLVASAVMLVEVGFPFIVYLVFAFRTAGRGHSPWRKFLAIFPALYLPFAFLLLPPNFGMRGSLPALIALNIGAALQLEEIGRARWTGWQRVLAGYGLALVCIAQMISPFVEWIPLARRAVGDIIQSPLPLLPMPVTFPDGDYALIPAYVGLPANIAYIRWANIHLPADALVVEEGPLRNDNRLHLLERMRMADPADVRNQGNGQRDITLAGAANLSGWWQTLAGSTAEEKALSTEYVRQRHVPVYAVVRNGAAPAGGELVYQDEYVRIYQVQKGG